MAKKRRLAGFGGAASFITGKHLKKDEPSADEVPSTDAPAEQGLEQELAQKVTEIEDLRKAVSAAETKLSEREQELQEQLQQARSGGAELLGPYELRHITPDAFVERPMDSDEITERDIAEMQDMICEQGLLQWPVVDKGNRPLAGRRRSLALQRIASEQPDIYQQLFPHGVPVIAMLEIDWDTDPLRADQEMLLMQHTQRRKDRPQLRDQKIRDIAQRMHEDERAKWQGGRLKSGEYHAQKRLTQLFGVSDKIVQRALAVDEPADESGPQDTEATWKHARVVMGRQRTQLEKLMSELPEIPPDWQACLESLQAMDEWLSERLEGELLTS